jgi:RND family efflux transporter MFP subunit
MPARAVVMTCRRRDRCFPEHPAWLLGPLLILILALGPPAGVSAGPPDSGQPPSVKVMAVQEQAVNPPVEYVGRMEAIQAVDLRARVEGYLERVAFQEGAEVKAGDLLFLIEQAPYRARLDEAQAKVTEAEAALDIARQFLRRIQAVKTGGVSAIDLETAESSERQAAARLQEAAAALQTARLNLNYTTIRAPISGRIGRTAFTRGNLVGPGSGPLARIVQTHPIRVLYAMSETDLMALRTTGDTNSAAHRKERLVSRLRLPNKDIYPHSGRFDFIDNQVDPNTGTIAVRAVFDNPDGLLLPGQFVTVMISRDAATRMPVIPQPAVQTDREGHYVFIVDDQDRAQLRRVSLGPAIGAQWSVPSGLSAGETIVVQGVQKVTPGQPVTPMPAEVPFKE